jgi:hypothetical protein
MASVVTFWQMPGEEERFLRYLAGSGEVVAIRHREAVPDPAAIRPAPIEEVIGRTDAGRLYLTLRAVTTGPLPLHRFEPASPGKPILYSLAIRFPAIVYDAGILADGRLSSSNAAAYPSQAPAEICAWMRRVFAWLRRNTPHWHEYETYRVTEQAARAALEGLALVPYHGWRGRLTGRSSFHRRPRGHKT